MRVVDGFIEGVDGSLSPQIDGLLVTGEGRDLPYGAGHVWPIQHVIAVLEVKKNLFGADLDDGFVKLRAVTRMQEAFMQSMMGPKPDVRPTFRAFAQLTGFYPRSWDAANALPEERSYIFHALLAEQLSPVRIIIGYHGYADEFSLRKGLLGYLQENQMTAGFGVTSLPNLIVCRGAALLKLNGQPYGRPMAGDWWPILVSNGENPLRLLIELIWTRLSNQFSAAFTMDDTLQMERLAPFLSARLARRGDRVGWEYQFDPIKRKQLAAIEPWRWEPGELDSNEWVLVQQVARCGELNVRDTEYRRYAAEEGFDADALVAGLVERRVLAWCDKDAVRLIDQGTLFTAFLPNGRTIGTTATDLLQLWLSQQLSAQRAAKKPESDGTT